MTRILLFLEQRENHRLLSEWLAKTDQVVIDGRHSLDLPFDLGIVDGPTLRQHRNRLEARKEADAPLFLPFLLITPRANAKPIPGDWWRVVDEVILAPVEKLELRTRIEVLLRTRRLSQELDQRYYALAEHSPMSICLVEDERLVYANPTLLTWSGRSLKEMKGTHVLDLIHPADHEKIRTCYRDVLATGTPRQMDEIRLRVPGEPRWVEMNTAAVVYQGKPLIMWIFSDITGRKHTERELRNLSSRLLEVQETERRHLARELHDEVGQMLTGLKLTLEMAEQLPGDQVQASLRDAKVLVDDLVMQVRGLSLRLRPSMLDDLGLLPALLWHFKRYTTQTRIQIAFEHRGLEKRRFAGPVETAVYRIVQEALTNVARHAEVDEVMVRIWTDPSWFHLCVEDRGKGFDPKLGEVRSSGLVGMRERASLLDGRLIILSAPGSGTRIEARLPLGERAQIETKER